LRPDAVQRRCGAEEQHENTGLRILKLHKTPKDPENDTNRDRNRSVYDPIRRMTFKEAEETGCVPASSTSSKYRLIYFFGCSFMGVDESPLFTCGSVVGMAP
jgi:hypothetical protein